MGELPNMLDLSNVADGSTFVVGGRRVRGAGPARRQLPGWWR